MTEQEFLEQINDHKEVIHKACNTYCNSYSRADLVQEILLEAWRSISNFKKSCKFSTWLYYITRNKCIDVLRRQEAAPNIEGLEEYANALADVNNEPELVDQLRIAMCYNLVLETLEEPNKRVFMMYLDGMSYKEISQHTGINENALRATIHRIVKRLKLRYGR